MQKTFSAIKQADIMYVNSDNNIQTVIGAVNGIRIIGSYNLPARHGKRRSIKENSIWLLNMVRKTAGMISISEKM